MFTVVVIMSLGILLGYFLRNTKKLVKSIDVVTKWAVFLLLFLLGLLVGANPSIIQSFDEIGLKALLITLGAVFGSVILFYATYVLFFKDYER